MKGKFLALIDTHFALSSNVRTGDYLDDLLTKFIWCIDYANSHDLTITISGDVFDKPTVPDEVKSRVIEVMRLAKHKVLGISGNHDRLYGSAEYHYRTSLNLLEQSGVFSLIDEPVEYEDCVLFSSRPMVNHPSGKPILNLYHGFLNQEDGLNTFELTDIFSDTNNIVVLGHDHTPHEPTHYKNTTVYRPGSFVRAIRNDSSARVPEALHIEFENNKPVVKTIPIEVAKPVELLFKHKVLLQQKTTVSSYSEIVEMLKNEKKGVSLFEALQQVSEPEIIAYIKQILEQ
jgi:DNA repair exonuclease SbcCD nuclease subunit